MKQLRPIEPLADRAQLFLEQMTVTMMALLPLDESPAAGERRTIVRLEPQLDSNLLYVF